jgi:hypothetical protein
VETSAGIKGKCSDDCDVQDADIQIRRLGPADAGSYRSVRLEGLRCNPEAFGSTFEAENARPLTFFSERLASSVAFGAFHGSELLGIAGLVISDGARKRTRVGSSVCTFGLALEEQGLVGDWLKP